MAAEYIRIIAVGTVFQLLATGFVPFIRNMGGVAFAMAAMIAGFLTNVFLDYIFVWKWGMAGAAWATVIGQGVTMLASVGFFVAKKAVFSLPPIAAIPPFFASVCKVAVAPFGLTISPVVTVIMMNRFLLLYGNGQDVAAYSCISYVVSIVYLLLQGVGDGSQPLISKRYGENDMEAVVGVRRLAYRTAFAITVACMALLFLARSFVGILFGASPDASREVALYLPLFLATMLFLAYVRVTTSYFYATEKTGLSYALVFAEPGFQLALFLTLPLALRLLGVWLTVPLAQILAWLVSVCAKHRVDRKMMMEAKKA